MNLENILNIAARIETLRTTVANKQAELKTAEADMRAEVAKTGKSPHAPRQIDSIESVLTNFDMPTRDRRMRGDCGLEYKYTSAEYRRYAQLLGIGSSSGRQGDPVWLIPTEVLTVRNAVYKARPDRYGRYLASLKETASVETETAPE